MKSKKNEKRLICQVITYFLKNFDANGAFHEEEGNMVVYELPKNVPVISYFDPFLDMARQCWGF